jgi:hypothetical protein
LSVKSQQVGPQPPGRYPTTVRDVEEISLTGTADAAGWQELLDPEGLTVYRPDDRAEVLLLACGSRFLGVRFRELSLSVRVSLRGDGTTADAYFLLAARNSVRFFAWAERTFFKTPYEHGEVRLAAGERPFLRAPEKSGVLLEAEMGEAPREASEGDEEWEGPIYLPTRASRGERRGKLFFAKLTGPSTVRRFDEASDSFHVEPRGPNDPFGILARTGFRPATWMSRIGGVHSRSRSQARPA